MRWLIALACTACVPKSQSSPAPAPQVTTFEHQPGMWYDPIDQRWWLTSPKLVTFEDAEDACSNGWRMPNVEEVRVARARGVCQGSCAAVWVSGLQGTKALVVNLDTGEASVQPKTDAAAASYCLQVK